MEQVDDHEAAVELAVGAGQVLLAVRANGERGNALKAAGDCASQEHLVTELARRFPDDGVLSEESDDDGRRLLRDRVWIIDPLDGTREFSEPGRTDWAVHVALVLGGRLVVGAVALPALGSVLSTAVSPGLPPLRSRVPGSS